jgi:hypothetical protein
MGSGDESERNNVFSWRYKYGKEKSNQEENEEKSNEEKG